MNVPHEGHCREVQAVIGDTLYFCNREVVEGSDFCQHHQPGRKVILTCECGRRYFVAGELLVPIKD